jgi:hypothetical protein
MEGAYVNSLHSAFQDQWLLLVFHKMLNEVKVIAKGMGSRFEFLAAGLPEQVRRLEEKGRFKDAVCLIDKILAKNESLPSALKSRLEWEPERIKRMQKGYALSWNEAFESLRNQIPDLTQKEFERCARDLK